jgi:hypothetical protein
VNCQHLLTYFSDENEIFQWERKRWWCADDGKLQNNFSLIGNSSFCNNLTSTLLAFFQPPKSSRRKFGTTLSTNIARTPPSQRSSVKKIVRVRKTPKSSNNGKRTPQASPSRSKEQTIIFYPGPVGLQLEPVAEDPKYGSRVVRFVDGGPKSPGQARKSGKIKPGDLVIRVEAESAVGTSYEEIIEVLKKSHAVRKLTFRSAWDPAFLDTQSSLKLHFQPTTKPPLKHPMPANGTETGLGSTKKSPLSITIPKVENISTASCKKYPSISKTTSKTDNVTSDDDLTPLSQAEASFLREPPTPLPPPSLTMLGAKKPTPFETKRGQMIDISLIQSPSEIALLSQTLTPLGYENNYKSDTKGPVIIPLKSSKFYQYGTTVLSPPPLTYSALRESILAPSASSETPVEVFKAVGNSKEGTLDQRKQEASSSPHPESDEETLPSTNGQAITIVTEAAIVTYTSPDRPGSPPASLLNQSNVAPVAKISILGEGREGTSPATTSGQVSSLSTPAKIVVPSDQMKSAPFSPSNVKKLSSKRQEEKMKPRLLLRVLGSVYNNVGPAVAHSSFAIGSTVANRIVPAVASGSYIIGSAVTTKIGERIVGNSSKDFEKANDLKMQLLRELGYAKAALGVRDTTKQQLEQNMDTLFKENLSIRAEFEQKIQIARVENVSHEKHRNPNAPERMRLTGMVVSWM